MSWSEGDKKLLTRPVAPHETSLASTSTTPLPLSHSSLAAKAPVIPAPMTTTSAVAGSSAVDRWPCRRGSRCQ